jgi:hypothetical protein
MKSPLEKVQALITLALDDSNNREEARNAAVQAIKLIRKHDLLVGEIPVRKLRRAPEDFLIYKIKKLAEEKTNQVVSELVKRAIVGDFPVISAIQITNAMCAEGAFTQDQKDIFYAQLRRCLATKMRHGILISNLGGKKGYQLARRGKSG